MDKPRDENPEGQLNEQEAGYFTPNRKRLRFFTSALQQEDEMLRYWASLSPIERLRHLHEMIVASWHLTEHTKQSRPGRVSVKILHYEPR